jgi:ABC-2 type transport system ATP-binding protein
MKSSAALSASGLTKRYGTKAALSDVSLAVPSEAICALIGPNGAGKSTLIKCWLGFERPTRGITSVGDHDPVAEPAAVMREVGYLAQGAPLYPDLSVNEHLQLAQGLRSSFDVDGAVVRLDALRISQTIRVGKLSGGEQAQVALAIVLATHPTVLVLDEPLASLDPLARREFLDGLVDAVRSERQTVVLSSHIVSDVEHACDTVIVLADGRVQLSGPVADAIAQHVVAPAGLDGRVIGPVSSGTDREQYLYAAESIASDGRLRPPSLEEVVLAYLAGARSHPKLPR